MSLCYTSYFSVLLGRFLSSFRSPSFLPCSILPPQALLCAPVSSMAFSFDCPRSPCQSRYLTGAETICNPFPTAMLLVNLVDCNLHGVWAASGKEVRHFTATTLSQEQLVGNSFLGLNSRNPNRWAAGKGGTWSSQRCCRALS